MNLYCSSTRAWIISCRFSCAGFLSSSVQCRIFVQVCPMCLATSAPKYRIPFRRYHAWIKRNIDIAPRCGNPSIIIHLKIATKSRRPLTKLNPVRFKPCSDPKPTTLCLLLDEPQVPFQAPRFRLVGALLQPENRRHEAGARGACRFARCLRARLTCKTTGGNLDSSYSQNFWQTHEGPAPYSKAAVGASI